MESFAYQQYQMARLAFQKADMVSEKVRKPHQKKVYCAACLTTVVSPENELCRDCINEMCENTGLLPKGSAGRVCNTCGKPAYDNSIDGCVDCKN